MRNKIGMALVLALGGAAATAQADVLINGAGATFPEPIYTKWFAEYGKKRPEQKFNYTAIGSGGGVKQITEKTVDFGASDVPMTDAELQKAPGVLHIPTVLGSVAVSYNGLPDGLRLTPEALAGLFLGQITRWNDPQLVGANPGVKLPDLPVAVVHRSDGSGTTGVFTDYLSKVSPAWKQRVGAGKSVKWPVGLGAKGNEGVTGVLKSTPGSVSYIELAYARQSKLPMAALKNADGQFVQPSTATTSAAADGADVPADFRCSITNARGATTYPLASFTYLLVYRDQPDATKGRALQDMMLWALSDGQKIAPALDYAPLPPKVRDRAVAAVKSLSLAGQTGQDRGRAAPAR